MAHIGDNVQCPECNKLGHIVWISQNKQMVGIQCAASHCIENRPDSHGFPRKASKSNKNSVFLVKNDQI
jgi:hypothetical protein